ncbi:MAG: hypothetical protein JWO67_3991 [Streptosporangiaceae bacterium]|nr:hypothetical protein [Streptosporangiaceae bacterium]
MTRRRRQQAVAEQMRAARRDSPPPPADNPGEDTQVMPRPTVRERIGTAVSYIPDSNQRARLLPPLTVAAIAADGMALNGSPWTAAGVAATTAAGIAALKCRRITGRAGWGYGATAAGYAAAWAAAIAAHGGVSWAGPTDAYLLGGAALLAIPHAYKRRWRYDPVGDVPVELPRFEEVTEFQAVWQDYIVDNGTVLSAARLSPEWEVPGGHQAEVIVPRGLKSTEDVIAAAKTIRSAYDKSPTQVIVEPTVDGRATRALLTVLKRDVLADSRVWTGPTLDPETGLAVIGAYPDGAKTHMQFFARGSGVIDTFVAGTKGSGKSRFLDDIAANVHLTPLGVLWVSDPQEGQSLSDWIDAAARYAIGGEEIGFDKCMAMLRALRRIVYRRSAFFAREFEWVDKKGRERKGGKTFFDPTPEIPFLYALLDEAHLLVQHSEHGKEALKLLGDIAKLSRKTGVGLTYVAHTPSLDEMGGHKAGPLRAMLREGNVVAFRTGESVAHHMLGLKSDPSKLSPYFADGRKSQGLALIKGPDGRDAPFRSEYVEDPYGIAQMPAAGQLDAMSLEAADAPDNPGRAPKTFVVPGIAKAAVPMIPTGAEQQSWAERILPVLADGEEHTFKTIWTAFPDGTSDRSIRYGLKALIKDGLVHTDGDKKPYRITHAGRARLEQKVAVA